MAEVYPSDSELLNLTAEDETGVEYIETGKAPYYVEFRKLLYRLLLAARRANDFRVYDEGGLSVGVKSGRYWTGRTLQTYAGSSGNGLADNQAAIYVYLNSSGSLVTDEYSSWPEVSENHVRLAVVTTSGGEITNIEDARDHHFVSSFAPALADGVVKASMLGSETATGVTSGPLACKHIGGSELKALLDGSVNELFTVGAGERPVRVELLVATATGSAGTVSVGFDAAADGTGADEDGWLAGADANTTGVYASDGSCGGAYVLAGKAATGAGAVTVTASTDLSGSAFVGQALMWYIAG